MTNRWLKKSKLKQLLGDVWTVSYQEGLEMFLLHDSGILPNHQELHEIIQELCKFYEGFSEEDIARHNQMALEREPSLAHTGLADSVDSVKKPTDRPASGFIYLIQVKDATRYKIGLSIHPNKRLTKLSNSSPYEMVIVHTVAVENMTRAERFLHEKYKEKRVRGEWFELNQSEVAEICSLKEGDL